MSAHVDDGAVRPAYFVHGDDAGLVSQALSALVDGLRALDPDGLDVVEEYGEPGRDEPVDVGAIVTACQTTPFFSRIRVVVLRDARALDRSQQKAVAEYLAAPLESSVLVLACVGTPPAALVKAVSAAGEVISAAPGSNARDRGRWVAEQVRASGLHLDGAATDRLAAHLGEDLARLEGIVGSLTAAYGTASTVRIDDLEPFLGEAGGVAPWDLTDAIHSGEMDRALDILHRMLGADRHPLQILAILHNHYAALVRLDGTDARSEADAVAATGLKGYPARKALEQYGKLGHDRVVQAVTLLADADLDLRGLTGCPTELVMEVLVGRLARLSGRRGARTRAGTR